MPTTLKSDRAEIGKRMVTKRAKGGDADLVVCQINLAVPCTRDQMAEIAGMPLAAVLALFDETGTPHQATSVLLTKRELLCKGKFARHIGADMQEDLVDPDKQPPSMKLTKAIVQNIRFVLDINAAGLRCSVVWKARGDEINDLEPLLGTRAEISLVFDDPKVELKKQGGKVQPEIRRVVRVKASKADLADKPGARKKRATRGQDAAAGEASESQSTPAGVQDPQMPAARDFTQTQLQVDVSQFQTALKIGFFRACRILEQFVADGTIEAADAKGWHKVKPIPKPPAGVGPGFASAVEKAARRHPRKTPNHKRTH